MAKGNAFSWKPIVITKKILSMSTILVGALLLSAIALISGTLIAISNQHKKKRKQKLLTAFSTAGSESGLSFTAQEILKNQIIGIDGINRKIAVVAEVENVFQKKIILLHEVKECSLQKNYLHIPASNGGSEEKFLRNISLLFVFKEVHMPPEEIVFYDQVQDHVFEIKELEQKAIEWRDLILKLIGSKAEQKRA